MTVEKTLLWRNLLLPCFLLWISAISPLKGDLEPTFGRCCGYGVNWAREKKQCSTFPAPVAGVTSEHQSICITSASICCLRMYRDEQCQKGKQFAQSGQECLDNDDEGGEFFKDCCDACKLGLVSGSMGMGCNMRFKFGFPWDNSYLQCCSQASPTNALTPDLSEPVQGGPGGQGFGFGTLYPGVSLPGISVPESEDLCARFPGKLCAHVCVPTPGSYRCQCRAGFTLSTDGKTCLQDALTDRCQLNNPCAHICRDTGISIECSCNPGYKLALDQRSCEDINECLTGQQGCVPGEQVCYNQVGSYACINADGSLSSPGQAQHQSFGGSIPLGHSGESRDLNLLGSTVYGIGDGALGVQGFPGARAEQGFLDATQSQGRCPPGYKFNLEIRACDDVDECEVVSELCGRGAICQNTIGSYSCTQIPVSDCPPGFAFDLNLQSCLDNDECADGLDNCDRTTHFCLNTQGSFMCQEKGGPNDCIAGYKYSAQQQTCVDVDECAEELHGCDPEEEVCRNIAGAYECDMKCDEGFQFSLALRTCVDRDECVDVPCDLGWECHNTAGSYTCHELPRALCPAGYKPSNSSTTGCEDVDECVEGLHICQLESEICINEIGKYRCESISLNEVDLGRNAYEILPQATFQTPVQECPEGFGFDLNTKRCLDIDECGTNLHNCSTTEKCINTLGGFACRTRRRCSAGYAPDPASGECKDVDECLAGVANCMPGQICVNTEGAFECRVECQDGFRYDPTHSAVCVDIDECLESPCSEGEQCTNTEGSYLCSSSPKRPITTSTVSETTTILPVSCPVGFGRNPNSFICEDIDECIESVCEKEQRCQNTFGSFLCVWLPCETGYHRDPATRVCEDINECEEGLDNCHFGIEECINTLGSHRCHSKACSPGYHKVDDSDHCIDIDECESSPCSTEEQCMNTQGSYRCRTLIACRAGFKRDPNTKQCEDIDECEENPCTAEERCVNIRGSYRCRKVDCSDGYQKDIVGRCRDINECETGEHNCKVPKEECINIQGSFRCRSVPDCPEGFTRDPESLRCVDVDECAEGTDDCKGGERCINYYGRYSCRGSSSTCTKGFRYNAPSRRCEDIDECAEDSFSCEQATQTCINSVGSYRCIDRQPACDFGYRFNEEQRSCVDIDECLENLDDCEESQECINTLGSYQCHTKGVVTQTCHPGFTFNRTARVCIDIDECLEGSHDCSLLEECVNRRGDYVCQPRETSNSVLIPSSQATGDQSTSDYDITESKEQGRSSSKRGRCDNGYRYNRRQRACIDIDECAEGRDLCNKITEKCVNSPGDYWCSPKPKLTDANGTDSSVSSLPARTTTTASITSTTTTTTTTPAPSTLDRSRITGPQCPPGTSYNAKYRSCRDIDECDNDPCDENELCENTQGSFKCGCRDGFRKDDSADECKDINECQLGLHSCETTQRCDNTIGSYACIRITGCGTGYTLNHNTGECDDNDECELGTHDCDQLGPKYQCYNIKGSFRCGKKACPPAQMLSSDGTCIELSCEPGLKPGDKTCIDINECAEGSPCRRNEQCLNTFGSYRCRALLNCGAGYQMNEQGTQCVDIDECLEGTHQCTGNQVCANRRGGYICQCPVGYRLNNQRQCEDVNECESYFGSICANNAVCENTDGSYRCNCMTGFKQSADSRTCVDIDECTEIPGICHHNCINIWGSHQCTCRAGYNLAVDNRTCTDIDECEEFRGRGRLCIGMCINTAGSFKCSCPDGYRLAVDGRTCKDIDECESGTVCQGSNEQCVNTRGGYKCNAITCPTNYIRDTQHKNRCKKVSLYCREDDEVCRRKPLSYSYNFLPLVSNLTLPGIGQVDLFTMRGPLWSSTTVQFELELVSARAPAGVEAATREFFHLKRTAFNQAVISLVKSIMGPQEVKLSLNMQLYHQGAYGGSAVAELLLYVSEYDF